MRPGEEETEADQPERQVLAVRLDERLGDMSLELALQLLCAGDGRRLASSTRAASAACSCCAFSARRTSQATVSPSDSASDGDT